MKKLMIAASAALCATVGFSLESANVVGYATKSCPANKFMHAAAQFESSGKTRQRQNHFQKSECHQRRIAAE